MSTQHSSGLEVIALMLRSHVPCRIVAAFRHLPSTLLLGLIAWFVPAGTDAALFPTGFGVIAAGPDACGHARCVARASTVPPAQYSRRPSPHKGTFLVASQRLKDPNFAHSVVLMVDYTDEGAMGIIINRPTTVPLAVVLPDFEPLQGRQDKVFIGGPVGRDRVVLLLRTGRRPDDTEHVFGDVYVSASQATLEQMLDRADAAQGERFNAYVGYAGWAPGQLDSEIGRGDWFVSDAEADIVFSADPASIWPDLIRRNSGRWVQRRSIRENRGKGQGIADVNGTFHYDEGSKMKTALNMAGLAFSEQISNDNVVASVASAAADCRRKGRHIRVPQEGPIDQTFCDGDWGDREVKSISRSRAGMAQAVFAWTVDETPVRK